MLLVLFSQGQDNKRNNIWMIGGYGSSNMGIDFNNGTPVTFSVVRPMEFFITNAGICDTNGQLFFYSNGDYIANRNHGRLYNTTNFNPTLSGDSVYGLNINQAVLILPYCNISNKYIVIHENEEYFSAHGMSERQPLNLRYSLVDMTLDSGLGGIDSSKKCISIINDTLTLGRLTACKHGNGRDWWVIVHHYFDDLYYKLLITPDSIFTYQQNIGSPIIYDGVGQAVFSSEGNKFALKGGGFNIDLMDFDRCTGVFNNLRQIYLYDIINGGVDTLGLLGCAFSPNGRYLYACNNLYIHQFDTWASNISNSDTIIGVWDSTYSPLATTFYYMQLAPDNKIYITTYNGTNVLHIINDPDSLGIGCNFISQGLMLPSYNALVLPNVPNYGLGAWVGSGCDTLPLTVNSPTQMESSIVIFPNPVTDNYFSISYFSTQNKSALLEIYNPLGEIVYSEKVSAWSTIHQVDASNLAAGLYILRITSAGMNSSIKFIKE